MTGFKHTAMAQHPTDAEKKAEASLQELRAGKGTYTPLLWWLAIIAVLYVLIGWSTGAVGVTACPDTVKGPAAENASLTILYFGNPFCVYCWIEDPIMERLSEQHKDVLRYEHYDNRYCTNHTKVYGIFAVPGFVFNVTNADVQANESQQSRKYPATQVVKHIGFLTEQYLSQVICDTTGSCGGLAAGPRQSKKEISYGEPPKLPIGEVPDGGAP